MHLEKQFQERIARAKQAARLASIAALARGSSDATPAQERAPPPPPPGFRDPTLSVDPVATSIPDDVRHRIDRLIEFIARNGPAFEETARQRERGNPDFAFLLPGGPFHEYFTLKKAQIVTPASAPPTQPRALSQPPPVAASAVDPMLKLSVGAMANACKAARARGLPVYTPLPPDLLVPTANVPPLEPARLDARLAEFYRSPWSS